MEQPTLMETLTDRRSIQRRWAAIAGDNGMFSRRERRYA